MLESGDSVRRYFRCNVCGGQAALEINPSSLMKDFEKLVGVSASWLR